MIGAFKTDILKEFSRGIFTILCMGVILNYGISLYFFIHNKRRYNEYTSWSFKITTYLLLFALIIGIILLTIK